MLGAIVASPFFADQPLPAAAFMLGSALPDLDALSRLCGKRAFLEWHQTYTHAIPVIVAACGLGWLVAGGRGAEFRPAILALGLGMILHVLLDLTNTYGVKILFPFSRRRFCLAWVFFIDAFVIAVNAVATIWLLASHASLRVAGHRFAGAYLLICPQCGCLVLGGTLQLVVHPGGANARDGVRNRQRDPQ